MAGISVGGQRPWVTVWDFRPDLESYDSLLLLIFGLEHSENRFQFLMLDLGVGVGVGHTHGSLKVFLLVHTFLTVSFWTRK